MAPNREMESKLLVGLKAISVENAAKMNTLQIQETVASSLNTTNSHNHLTTSNNINYCILPSLHLIHSESIFSPNKSHNDDQEGKGLHSLNAANEFPELAFPMSIMARDHEKAPADPLHQAEAIMGPKGKSSSGWTSNQLLDPYIDAVQVRGRVNNKRGERVKAASSNLAARDHEPRASYYSKTVHIEKAKGDHYESSDKGASSEYHYEEEDDSDDDDDDDHYDDHYEHDHGKKKKKVKKVYVKKYPKSKKVHHHGKYHKKNKKKKKRKYPKVKRKKVKYAYVYQPKKSYDHHHHHHDDHDEHDYKKHHHEDKYKLISPTKSGHSNLVHLDMLGKSGKMSVAGLLGYTLLCVNYLLILQEPTYDSHSGHYFTKYAPHGGKGDMVRLKSGGPVILAHCGELHESRALQTLPSGRRETKTTQRELTKPPEVRESNNQSSGEVNGDGSGAAISGSLKAMQASASSANVDIGRLFASSPPTYYYTLAPSISSGARGQYHARGVGEDDHYNQDDYQLADYLNQQYVRSPAGRSLLSPIQNYLNQLLLPTGVRSEQSPLIGGQLVSSAPRNSQLLGNPNDQQPLVRRLRRPANAARLLLVGDGQPPQLVNTKDNLVEMRRRQVDIKLQVIRNKFSGSSRQTSLLNADDWLSGGRGPNDNLGVQVGMAVGLPGQVFTVGPQQLAGNNQLETERMQADQPQTNNMANDNRSSSNAESGPTRLSLSPGNNQILDLPEYALSGDSIELTCNHRMQAHRLYSVKWFKDSLEFYRFIPANAPRSKSALFLPDVRLDLARSNSELVYLRNVSHRSSGLYRCEAVSEGPNFETVSGERRMQVYSLPESGPQLSLLENAEIPSQVALDRDNIDPARRVRTQLLERQNESQQENENANANENTELLRPLPADGPLIRCASARSNPAAQLRFFINNRPVELARTLENSTGTYSDGLESNSISFRLILSDFLADQSVAANTFDDDTNDGQRAGRLTSSLDRAASLKSNSSRTDRQSESTLNDLRFKIQTTTTTSTTTTPKPKLPHANANVQFDDQNIPTKPEIELKEVKAKRLSEKDDKQAAIKRRANRKQNTQLQQEQQQSARRRTPNKASQTNPAMDTQTDAEIWEHSQADELDWHSNPPSSPATSEAKFPVSVDKAIGERKLSADKVAPPTTAAGDAGKQANSQAQTSSGMGDYRGTVSANFIANIKGGASIGRTRREANLKDFHVVQKITRVANASRLLGEASRNLVDAAHSVQSLSKSTIKSDARGNNNNRNNDNYTNQRLTKLEQRVRQSNAGNQVAYSNYIIIKCTSLVPSVGYQMTSELNVPLTLLVSARQLSDALRSSQLQQQQQQQQRASSQEGRRAKTSGERSDDGLFETPRASRNGGSLQAPKAVLIDRLAQASTPTSGKALPASSITNTTSAHAARASKTRTRDRKLEQLRELAASKQRESATNGSPSHSPATIFSLVVPALKTEWKYGGPNILFRWIGSQYTIISLILALILIMPPLEHDRVSMRAANAALSG